MDKLLEVREFDKISCNPDFKTEYAYLAEPVFRDLVKFIHAYTGDEEHADAGKAWTKVVIHWPRG